MNERLNKKRLILIALSVLSIVMLFITLAFNFISIKTTMFGESNSEGKSGYFFIEHFSDIEDGLAKWIGIFNIFMIIFACVEILLYGYKMYMYMKSESNSVYYSGKSLEKVEKTVCITNFTVGLVYLINAITWVIKTKNDMGEFTDGIKVRTFAFIPFIFLLVIAIAYKVLMSKGEDSIPYNKEAGAEDNQYYDALPTANNIKTAQYEKPTNTIGGVGYMASRKPVSNVQAEDIKHKKILNVFEVLIKAKELYDQNIITNEEFEKIKKQYLNEIIK